ncbi:hypothetical protein JDV02_007231 [Purpureocillium takamizusanense]|uniref:Uncharacterized protein n=1 Tax=Purpureocillium takamizusanense TaxID=2060973 RepID=A0A9Q8QK94_9HYPO|nr:uncharacterized protein JDV02_007231 [Purpureocillium takamizusanense]UNI21220.1 hypothetical protein JDV02_007231 [Purpureocillium takamizusanense]
MNPVAALLVALAAAVSASPTLAERARDKCPQVIEDACFERAEKCQEEKGDFSCPFVAAEFCPCFDTYKICMKSYKCSY